MQTQAMHRLGWSQTSTPTHTLRTAAVWLKRWSRTSFKAASSPPRRQTMKRHRRCVCFKRIPLWRNLSLPPRGEPQIAKKRPVGKSVGNSNRPAFSEKFHCTIFAVKQKKSSEIFRFQNLFWSCYPDLNWRPHPYQNASTLFLSRHSVR